ncbi:MAG: hypothetical protein P1V36_11635 [Planctomycetota bacterium]|nr:hypothetical protein [Planctomycetota bacterium]
MLRAITSLLLPGLLAALLFAGPGTAVAADGPLGVRKPMPKTLKSLEARLGDLQQRIDKLVEAASRDAAERWIEIYRKYTPKELKKTRGRVRVKQLVGYMVDKDQNFQTVREAARKAIHDGGRFRGDPDLSDSEKQGPRTKRAHFCWKELAPYLKDENIDRVGRKLVNDLLNQFYGQAARTHPEIRIYNQDTSGTWKPAYNAWVRFLKKS